MLILVIPILALQAVVATVFIRRHYDALTAQMAGSVAREIGFAIRAVEEAETGARAAAVLREMSAPFGLELSLEPHGAVEPGDRRVFYDLTGSVIAETFDERIRRPVELDFVDVRKQVELRVGTSRGVLVALIPRGRMNASNPHLLLVWMASTALGLVGVAAIFLRNQVRPIRELSRAATAFGRGRTVTFRPSGAEEVRRAGHAFIDMRARIERQIAQRTLMLSGVGHDLRTPLTRMKLALAVMEPTPEAEELGRDVAEMERMIDGFLDFARGEGAEAPEPVDPASLASEIAEQAGRRGREVELVQRIDTPDAARVALRRDAMRRCVSNLVENALAHGDRVRLSVRLSRRALEFMVEDDGPGIPEDRRQEALRPFARLDAARNQDRSPGVGLGLSIALDIARSHGGALDLDDSPDLGGLRAAVRLPR